MSRFMTGTLSKLTVIKSCGFPRLQVDSASSTAVRGQRAGRGRPAGWSCFFIISLLTTLSRLPTTFAKDWYYYQNIQELQQILEETKDLIKRSGAPVYSSVLRNIPERCMEVTLTCFLLELEMILLELEMMDDTCCRSHNIRSFIEDCSADSSSESCSPCESETVDTTIFIHRLEELLKVMMSAH